MTKRFVFDLCAARRDALEAYRVRHGLRSLAGALHHMIDNAALIEAARRLAGPQKPAKCPAGHGDQCCGAPELCREAIKPQKPVSNPKPTKTPEKREKAARGALAAIAAATFTEREPHAKSAPKPAPVRVAIQFGPPDRKPGDLAKKGTRK